MSTPIIAWPNESDSRLWPGRLRCSVIVNEGVWLEASATWCGKSQFEYLTTISKINGADRSERAACALRVDRGSGNPPAVERYATLRTF